MFNIFDANTADELWRKAFIELNSEKLELECSRLGPMRELLHCSLHLQDPKQRWVLSRRPAINPAFAIAEVVWILLGKNDSGFLNFWNPLLPKYAGSGQTYHGAYGHRLRSHFGFDQIERAYSILESNPESRQVVLQIWDSQSDLPLANGISRDADIPCNVMSMLKIRSQKLEWLQVMRSNDIFLGTPHNFVQFTSLQEVISGWLGIQMGSFVLVSDSLHLYEKNFDQCTFTDVITEAKNNDSLALSRTDFVKILPILEDCMNRMQLAELKPKQLLRFIETLELPSGWANYMYIAGADAARRRSWKDEASAIAEKCSNPALIQAWSAWLERCQE
ncbi:thymidylate synthase [Comamonas sp. MYb21]|uniref:thymidylate synthase n=1 Tax=Comamonas sp. MYb21 TaxID=1848648 RepID=UPI0030A66312